MSLPLYLLALLRLLRHLGVAVGLGLAPLAAAPVEASLRIIIPRLSLSGLNENDSRAAMSLFITEVGRRYGYAIQADIAIVEDPRQLPAVLHANRTQLLVVTPWDYLTLGLDQELDVAFVAVSSTRAAHASLLLARRDHPIQRLQDLRGRRIRVLNNYLSSLGLPWLETLLLDRGLGPAAAFFAAADTVERPSAAVLPVFFGQLDACIVDDAAYATMVELNPALARELAIIAQSPPFANVLVCLARSGWEPPALHDDLIRGLGELQDSPAGRQGLALFKYDRLQPYQPALLDTLHALHRRHQELTTSPGL